MLTEVPVSLVMTIRGRRLQVMRVDDGVVEVAVRNSHRTETGRRVGDLWFRFTPNPKED